MELGIEGRWAVVCGSSRGLGLACAKALAREGVHIVLNARTCADVVAASDAIRAENGVDVRGIAADISTAEGRETLLAACPDPDILINNNGGPAPAYLTDMDQDRWAETLGANMIAPLMLTQSVLPHMKARKFGRIVNITSAMVTTPRPHMIPSAGARAGLTAVMKGVALEVARHNVTINNLLPERFDTDRQHRMAQAAMEREGITYEEARERQVASIAARRMGDPEEFGATCAFLCSALAGFISGQNIHLDGGSYPALI